MLIKVVVFAALVATVAASCSLSYTNTPGNGLYYVTGYDYGGHDASATPNVASPVACQALCASAGPTILAWQYDTSSSGTHACWCKDQILSTPNAFGNRAAGPMSGTTITVPAGGERYTACGAGVTPINDPSYYEYCDTAGSNTWYGQDGGTNPLGCNAVPCTFNWNSSTILSSGVWYITGLNYNGHDYSATPNVPNARACQQLCASVTGATILMWQYDTRSDGNQACWCKDTIDPAPTQNGNRAVGLVSASTTLTGLWYGLNRYTSCGDSGKQIGGYSYQTCDSRVGTWTGASQLACVQLCSQAYVYSPLSGIQYMKDYDWYGHDVASTTGVGTAVECMQFCNSTVSATPISAWAWETERSTHQCWCKGTPISDMPFAFGGRATGAMPRSDGAATIVNVPAGVTRINACGPGMQSTHGADGNPKSDGSYQTCQSGGAWTTTALTNVCEPETKSGLSAGAIAGIVIGSIVGLALIGYGCHAYQKRSRPNAPLLPQPVQPQPQQIQPQPQPHPQGFVPPQQMPPQQMPQQMPPQPYYGQQPPVIVSGQPVYYQQPVQPMPYQPQPVAYYPAQPAPVHASQYPAYAPPQYGEGQQMPPPQVPNTTTGGNTTTTGPAGGPQF